MAHIETESGLTLHLPEGRNFRFQNLPTYIHSLKNKGVKEMDFAWCYEDGDDLVLVLLEVKNYARSKGVDSDELFATLRDKVSNALFMLLAAWAGTGLGRKLREELPRCAAEPPTRIRVVLAVDFPPDRRSHLLAIRDTLAKRLAVSLAGLLALAGAGSLKVLEFGDLKRRFPSVVASAEEAGRPENRLGMPQRGSGL